MAKKSRPILIPALFNLRELAIAADIDYYRLFHVVQGNRISGFTFEEKKKLEEAVLTQSKKLLTLLGSTKVPV